MIATDRRSYLLAYGAFALLALIWGFSYILIKIGVTAMPVTEVVLIRVGSGAVALLAVFGILRRSPNVPGLRAKLPGFALMALTSSMTAVFWGALIFNERLALQAWIGMAVILFSVFLTSLLYTQRVHELATEAGEASR